MAKSNDINPYESPRAAAFDATIDAVDGDGLWRQGTLLVVHFNAQFPRRCVMTNQEADARYPDELVKVEGREVLIPVSQDWVFRWRRNVAVGWTLFLGGIALAWFCPRLPGPTLSDLPPVVGTLMVMIGLFYFLLPQRRLGLHAESLPYFWLSGVHPGFLKHLPEWPYDPK
jgi:hypothetical protein